MRRLRILAVTMTILASVAVLARAQRSPQIREPQRGMRGGIQRQAPYQLTPEERREIETKTKELGDLVSGLRIEGVDENLLADVEIYLKAAQWVLEFPEDLFSQEHATNTIAVLDQGLERGRLLQKGESPWVAEKSRKIHGYYSDLDGSVQPYGLTVPKSYDGSESVPLFVFLHGRTRGLTEVSFMAQFPTGRPSNNAATYEGRQIHLDVYGRGNNAFHWAGEVDVLEAIAAVQERYKIDPKRVVLRGFSLGGAGAWHLALHYPDRFVSAEIGAGTWPRRSLMGGFPPYQEATLRIWENINDWALNAFNIPIGAHGGDGDNQVASIPRPTQGHPTRGQLESSLRVRAQLEIEGFAFGGEPDYLRAEGLSSIFLISVDTQHATSPLVRERLNEFTNKWVERGQVSPDHVRFVTYTTRYNKAYWVSVDGLGEHYQRAEIDAKRSNGGKHYEIATRNVTRLILRETSQARQVMIDGNELSVKSAPEIRLEKTDSGWRVASGRPFGLRKTHALQGPIDDAFLNPYLLVRPTGTPWHEAAHRQALRMLQEFDQNYARNYRAHPRIKNDTEVAQEDFARFNVVLFGDPGSNRWISQVIGKLPVGWTRESVRLGNRSFAANEHVPALIYPNPLNPSRYVVINSGLTISPREYNSDYSMPRLGDFAVLKVAEGDTEVEADVAGLFDESWQLPADLR